MDKIIVLDFGSQYNQLIVKMVRKLGVYSELISYDTSASEILRMKNVRGIILSGGPHSVYGESSYKIDKKIYDLGIPILGICYGMQLIAEAYGGVVKESTKKEYGKKNIDIIYDSLLFESLPHNQLVWMSHGDEVEKLPNGFSLTAKTVDGTMAAIENQKLNIYAVQFHPEVKHSEYGLGIIDNFVSLICNTDKTYNMDNFITTEVESIKETVKNNLVLMGISGGVDSSVAAVLINKAIGDNLTCMFIDHGLLRKNEADLVMKMFKDVYHINVIKVDASARFLKKLVGVTDPEEKRKIIGNEFIYVFEEESLKLNDYKYLAQGTLYTDIIESGTKTAETIKSHHNVGGLPKDMKFKILEPLKTLFKDEVRELGKSLGLHESLVNRQPFPGPGLAIRVLGEITADKLEIVRESDSILREEFLKAGLDKTIWQYFTVLPNLKSVGVMGDKRTYMHTVAIRAVTSVDGMTSDWARIPYDVLDTVSRRIVNEVKNTNRVVLDITSKPPATIEWE